MKSILETYDVTSGERKVLKIFDEHTEAPNWLPDGSALIYNSGGKLYRFDLNSGESALIPTGKCDMCNNDHVVSANGRFLYISSGADGEWFSRIWEVPISGGEPRLVVGERHSYLHGVSPDGKTLAYCAMRGDEFDIHTMPVSGGEETRLTDAPGLNDGSEYSRDGQHIWFNSVRTGRMQAWRMNSDGSEQTQMTFDEDLNTWFPHISPDGKQVVMISYRADDVAPGDHPANKNVLLRIMNADGSNVRTLLEIFGGQGTINVNSWSPCSAKFAFVRYEI